jgi:uncharacterized tellurite resistance protein B-like protein
MQINLADFTEPQRQALLDLLVLATYLDRHLDQVEDDRVKRLLDAMGHATPYDRQRSLDASVTRTRQYAETPELVRLRTTTLAQAFKTQDQCRHVCDLLEDLISCDGHVVPEERNFMNQLRDIFQVP